MDGVTTETEKDRNDFWDRFSAAVADPKQNVYEFLRTEMLKGTGLHDVKDLRGILVKGKHMTLEEFNALSNPEQLSKRLKSLEENSLLIRRQPRAVIKTVRILIDAYIATQKEEKEKLERLQQQEADAREKTRLPRAMRNAISWKRSTNHMRDDIRELAAALNGKSEEEIRATIKEAATQLAEPETTRKMMRDVVGMLDYKDVGNFLREFFKPSNVRSWGPVVVLFAAKKYILPVAAGLFVYSARRGFYNIGLAGFHFVKNDREKAQEHAAKSYTEFKASAGTFAIAMLSPFIGPQSFALRGFIIAALETIPPVLINAAEEFWKKEKEEPGSTKLGKKIEKGVSGFFKENAQRIANETTALIGKLTQGTAAKVLVDMALRGVPGKVYKLGSNLKRLSRAVRTRFNAAAAGTEQTAPEKMQKLEQIQERRTQAVKDDIKDIGATLKDAYNDAVGKATDTPTTEEKAQQKPDETPAEKPSVPTPPTPL